MAPSVRLGYTDHRSLHTAKALVQPALVPKVWLTQRDVQRGDNLFPCEGIVEVPNLKGPLRDQRSYIGLLPNRPVERLLEGRDVTTLFQDQKDLLPPGSSDGEDLRSRILGVTLAFMACSISA